MIDEWIEMRKNEKLKKLVAIPVFNESDVYDIIQRVKKVGVEVLVLDDGSTNDIGSSLKGIQGIQVIRHQRNLGYGQTIIDAFNFAINNDYAWMGDRAKREYWDQYKVNIEPGETYEIPIQMTIPEKVSGIRPSGKYTITVYILLKGVKVDTKIVTTVVR